MRAYAAALFTLAIGSVANAQTVAKSAWMDGMSTALPTGFCAPGQYFRECFAVSSRECEEVAASAARICLDRHKDEIPETLAQPKDGEHWGNVVGQCAGRAYDLTLAKKRLHNPRCDNPNSWR